MYQYYDSEENELDLTLTLTRLFSVQDNPTFIFPTLINGGLTFGIIPEPVQNENATTPSSNNVVTTSGSETIDTNGNFRSEGGFEVAGITNDPQGFDLPLFGRATFSKGSRKDSGYTVFELNSSSSGKSGKSIGYEDMFDSQFADVGTKSSKSTTSASGSTKSSKSSVGYEVGRLIERGGTTLTSGETTLVDGTEVNGKAFTSGSQTYDPDTEMITIEGLVQFYGSITRPDGTEFAGELETKGTLYLDCADNRCNDADGGLAGEYLGGGGYAYLNGKSVQANGATFNGNAESTGMLLFLSTCAI